MSEPTFTNQEGGRIKNISHKNLGYHAKDGGLLVKFKNTGKGQYGPYAFFNVDGDESGDYVYKPESDANFGVIEAVRGKWVLVTMCQTYENGDEGLALEDQDGLPVLPGAATGGPPDMTAQPGDFDHTPEDAKPQTGPPPMTGGPNPTEVDKVFSAAQDTVRVHDMLKKAGVPLDSVSNIFCTLYINATKNY